MGEPVARRAGGKSVWRVALYIRLSREDGNDESLSVANQRKIILEYLAHSFQGAYELAGEYVDDGVSGTDYERPGFQRMLGEIQAGRVDCVVCKTLSRAFRNYADQGYFLEHFFPAHGTRFITLGEPKLDSFLQPELLCGFEVPLSGIMNDRYAGKTSLDVRRTFDMKRRRGEFIGAFAPYGYAKDPLDKNRLVVDGEAAAVVQEIFQWYQEGESCRGIALRLNSLGIPSPSAYKRRCGLRYHHPRAGEKESLWGAKTVSEILRNQAYAGTMVQGKQRVVSYKVHQRRSVPREEWFVVPDAVPQVVDREVFARVQQLAARPARTAPGRTGVHLWSGLLYCAGCGRALKRKTAKGYTYYACRPGGEGSPPRCAGVSIRTDRLERAVLSILQGQIRQMGGREALTAERLTSRGGQRLDQLKREQERERAQLVAVLDELYVDWKKGLVTQQVYCRIQDRVERQLENLEGHLASWSSGERVQGEDTTCLGEWLAHQTLLHLERGLLVELVDRVLVGRDGAVELHVRFCAPAGQAGRTGTPLG